MARIPAEVKEFLEQGRLAYVATSSRDGVPHCVPKGSMAQLDDEHLIFADLSAGRTRKNLEENPHVAIAIVNPAAYEGYEFIGSATIIERGEEYDELASGLEHGQMEYRNAKHAVKVRVEEIRDVGYRIRAARRG